MIDISEITNVTFGFNESEIVVPMGEQKAKELFYEITGVTILDDSGNENIYVEDKPYVIEQIEQIEQRISHPTLQQLVELFKENINNEIGSELIKNTFYRQHSGKWRKILVSIFDKIQKALRIVELSENGKYEKRRHGKFVNYIFVPNKAKNTILDNYGIC